MPIRTPEPWPQLTDPRLFLVLRPDVVAATLAAIFVSYQFHTADDERVCIGCGCSDSMACPGGCSWPRPDVDLCSSCVRDMLVAP